RRKHGADLGPARTHGQGVSGGRWPGIRHHPPPAGDDHRHRRAHQCARRPAPHHRDRVRWHLRHAPRGSRMIPGLEMLACQDLAVPVEVMEHVVRVESSFNPYAIGVVGARLARQPRSLDEAVATATRLERQGYNFSLGLAQVNRHNLAPQGLADYATAFATCPNLAAGARILADCHRRAGGDWGKAFSCYYSGNFTRGFRHGYVQKVLSSLAGAVDAGAAALGIGREGRQADSGWARRVDGQVRNLIERRIVPESVADRAGALPEAI